MARNKMLVLIPIILMFLLFQSVLADVKEQKYGCFEISHELTLPVLPETIYDAISGDISEWWDHSFASSPYRFYIEAKPGGGFYELFDDNGNGVLHATVIVANRGKMLRFEGPLGLSGRAVKMVHTYTFDRIGRDSTLLKLSVHISGEIDENLAATVEQVWYHFLFEQFKPYVEEGNYLPNPFEQNQSWGYKNNQGQITIQPRYQLATEFSKYGIASVIDDRGWGYIDRTGKILARPYIVDNGPDYFNERVSRFVADGKIGFINQSGTKIIPAKFDFVMPFSEGLAAFCVGCRAVPDGEYHRIEGGKWGYINKTGEIVVIPEYDSVGPFQDGKATVTQGGQKIILNKQDLIE
jgi:hypothetical protein